MALTPGTWYVRDISSGYLIDSEGGGRVVRGAGGFRNRDDAVACAYLHEQLAELRAVDAAFWPPSPWWDAATEAQRAAVTRVHNLLGVLDPNGELLPAPMLKEV